MVRLASNRCKPADRVHSILQILLPPTKPNAPTSETHCSCVLKAFTTYSLGSQASTAEGRAGASNLAGQAADKDYSEIRHNVRQK